ncbi:MAG: cyclodeaminase/cyclohydrolase family protein, partial [Bacteroidales bacterium]|jgi:glutamate formiminotransferase/formiminotetrahydrofolate cyclodeaminase|nr:cyclodeaminase/cyclohydrolase family protein [Bacteroidales bacterium]
MKAMAEIGMAASASDVGVGALCARTAVMGAYLNVKINAGGLEDKAFAEEMVKKGEEIAEKAKRLEEEVLQIVESKIRK